MSKKIAGPEIERLVQLLARLPGLGPRSARKAVLTLLKRRTELLLPLSEAMRVAVDRIAQCASCGNLDTLSPCSICQDQRRDDKLIVVVEDVGDLWAIERAGIGNARYHVLGGHLSPLDGIGPEQLNIASLLARVETRVEAGSASEVLLALNATVEGQSTAHYVSDLLAKFPVTVSRLAQGVPVGGELDYLDDGTLAAAFKARRQI